MPSNAAASAPGGQEPAARSDWKWNVGRAVVMYVGMNAVMNPGGPIGSYIGKLFGKQPPAPIHSPAVLDTPSQIGSDSATSTVEGMTGGRLVPSDIAVPAWPQSTQLDFYVFVSSAPAPQDYDIRTQLSDVLPDSTQTEHTPPIPFDAFEDLHALLDDPLRLSDAPLIRYPAANLQKSSALSPLVALKWHRVPLGDSSATRDADVVIPLDDEIRYQNGSIWADLVVTKAGVSPDPKSATYQSSSVYRSRKLLSRLMALKRKRTEKNLFDKDAKSEEVSETEQAKPDAEAAPAVIVGHWHKNLTLALVQDDGNPAVQLNNLPPPVLRHVSVLRDPQTMSMVSPPDAPVVPGRAGAPPQKYVLRYPTVFPNDFWLLKEHMHPINDSVTELPLHINLYHQSWFKFQILASMADSFDKQQGGVTGGEVDMIKTMLLETNPWFLAITIIVSMLHSLFEFLAFSSEVRHWKNKDDLSGVSVGSILTNVVVQLIITLYLLDNNEDTSWMILAGQAVGVLIECWKLTKAVTVGLKPAPPGSLIPYRLKIEDKHKLSEEERKTQEYDKLAFKYVGIAVGPVLVGYTIYSALYQTHRGWWSFIISTATSFVYAFGFVSLVPQLIVNYKLKSTAGMNHKTFVYKILGTFVDDLFAFCIKMPTLHRLACFRDDVVFFIFLYQKWIYGVDPTRRNEYGQVVDKDGKTKQEDVPKDTVKKGDDAVASGVQLSTTTTTARKLAN